MNGKTLGRAVAAALLIQGVTAPITYFNMLVPGTSPDFLTGAAPFETQIRVALLIQLAAWSMSLTIVALTYPVFRQSSERLAIFYAGLVAVGGATMGAEIVAGRDMLSLAMEYAKAGANHPVLETLGVLARRHRITAHFTNLVFAHGSVLVMWILMYRARVIPRALAVAGALTATLSTSAMLGGMGGIPFRFEAVAPLGLATLALTVLLLWRGFAETPPAGVRMGNP